MTPDYDVQAALDRRRYEREAQNENAARYATYFVKHTTTGTGSIRVGLVSFDVVFLEEPSLVSGVVLEKAPDVDHYRLPSVTAGVHRWETTPAPQPAKVTPAEGTTARPSTRDPKLYVGAHLYFNVDAAPLYLPRTDGSNLADLQTRLARAVVGSPDYVTLTALVAEAQEALYLTANPAQVTITHHLQFQGLALKASNLAASDMLTGVLNTRMPTIG